MKHFLLGISTRFYKLFTEKSQNCWDVKYCKLSWLLESENSALTSDPDKTGFYSTTKKLLRDLTIDTMCNKLDHQWHQNDQYWSFLWNGSSKIQIFTDIWYLFYLKTQEYTDTFRQNLTCIFLSVRAILKETFQCETPCILFWVKIG